MCLPSYCHYLPIYLSIGQSLMTYIFNVSYLLYAKKHIQLRSQAHYLHLPVKVTMDGIPVGRRVDLRYHESYVSLTQKLDDMFRDFGEMAFYCNVSFLI